MITQRFSLDSELKMIWAVKFPSIRLACIVKTGKQRRLILIAKEFELVVISEI